MDSKRIGALAAAVAVLGVVVQYVPSFLLDRWMQDGARGGGVPTFGTVGETVATYNVLVGVAEPLVTVALSVWLGYRIADRLDLPREFRRFGRAVAAGSLVGPVLAWVAVAVAVPFTLGSSVAVVLALGALVQLVASVSLVVTVGAVAGAALSHFRATDGPPSRPTGTDGRSDGSRGRDQGIES